MRPRVLAASTAFVLLCSPAIAQDLPPPTPIAEWPRDKVTRIGQAIFDQDRAAWVASDALMAHLAGSTPPDGMVGWIVVPDEGGQRVRFLRQDGEAFTAVYEVPVHRGRAGAVQAVQDGTLPPDQAAQARARMTAASNIGRLRCSQRLNTVVLDDPDGDGWLVWLLTSTTDANIVPVGGHYRFTISADGSTVQSRDMLSNGCLSIPKGPPPGSGQRGRPAGIVVNQIVSDGPVETHVFLSLVNGVPIYVSAGDSLFEVDGAQIRTGRTPR